MKQRKYTKRRQDTHQKQLAKHKQPAKQEYESRQKRHTEEKNQDMMLSAVMTIEAAVIVPTALIAILSLTMLGLKLHDIVIGNMTANEAAELYNYLPEDIRDAGNIESYGETRLQSVLSGMNYTLDIEEYKEGSRVHLGSESNERIYEDAGSRPEKLMRKLTLTDAFRAEGDS